MAILLVLIGGGVALSASAPELSTGAEEAVRQIDEQIAQLKELGSPEADARVRILEEERARLLDAIENPGPSPVPVDVNSEPSPHLDAGEWDRGETPCEPIPGITDGFELPPHRCVSLISAKGEGLTVFLTMDGWALVVTFKADYTGADASKVEIPELPDLLKAEISIDKSSGIHVSTADNDVVIATDAW